MSLLNYIKGLRKGKDARRLELEAMNDPFLAEAIEGYDTVGGDHMSRITSMQRRIAVRTKVASHKAWIPYASAAAVLIAVAYFTIWNNISEETIEDTFYVYVPDAYIEKQKMEMAATNQPVNSTVDIKNIEILAPDENIDIYIPEEYVEKKKSEISKGYNKNRSITVEAATVITNLDEIFEPEEVLEIYIPQTFLEKETQNNTPKVRIENVRDL